jgi:hypothetical protein
MTNNPPDGDTATGFYAYYQVIDPGIHYRYDPGFGTWPNPGTSGLLNRNVIFNMRITYTTNQTSNEVVAALLGTVVGSIVTSGIILLRDKAQDHQLRISRKSIAYAHLKETLTRIEAKSGSNFKTAKLNEKNYDMLQETVANNYDVLDKDTVKAWTSKKITHHVTNGVFDYEINLEQFKEDVMRH